MTEFLDGFPLFVGVGQRDPRGLVHARDPHRMFHFRFAGFDGPADRRGPGWFGCAGDRQMTLAGEQPGGGIEPDPSRARQIDFHPRVQIGEVLLRSGRTIERFFIGLELDQIPGNEAGGQTEATEQIHQQPRRVAARSAAEHERFLRRLHARFQADQIRDPFADGLVEGDQDIDRAAGDGAEFLHQAIKGFPLRLRLQVGNQIRRRFRRIHERIILDVRFEEEIEGIDDGHFRHQIDGHGERFYLFGKDQPREIVPVGILLPVQEMIPRFDLQTVGKHPRAAVGGRAQSHHMGRVANRPIVAIAGLVVQGDMNGHGGKG